MSPRPDQQPDSATGCLQRGVIGEHPGEEEVVPAALQVHHRRHPADIIAVVSGLPVQVVRAVTDPLLEPRHSLPGQRDVGVGDGQCGHRSAQRLGAGEHAEELADRSTVRTKHAIDDLHPAQCITQRESAAWIHEQMGKLGQRVLDDRDLPLRDVAGGELPLGETQVAGTPGGQYAAEPRDRKSTRLNSSHSLTSRMPSSA